MSSCLHCVLQVQWKSRWCVRIECPECQAVKYGENMKDAVAKLNALPPPPQPPKVSVCHGCFREFAGTFDLCPSCWQGERQEQVRIADWEKGY